MNLFIFAILAVALGALLIVILGFRPYRWNRREVRTVPASMDTLTRDDFFAACERLVSREMGLSIDSEETSGDHLEMKATDGRPLVGGTYVIHGIFCTHDEMVDSDEVRSLAGAVIADEAVKGILFTNGQFTPPAQQLGTTPLELVDRDRLVTIFEEPSGAGSNGRQEAA